MASVRYDTIYFDNINDEFKYNFLFKFLFFGNVIQNIKLGSKGMILKVRFPAFSQGLGFETSLKMFGPF